MCPVLTYCASVESSSALVDALTGPIPIQAEKIAPEAVAGFKSRYGGWLEAGFYLPPSAYEVGFLSAAHSPNDVERLIAAL